VTHLLVRPRGARYLLVLAHGAGAGMRHTFMQELADELAGVRVATWRWEFPYMAAGRKLPDKPAVAEAAVRDAWTCARAAVKLPAFAGGKSFGGRMTSQAHAGAALPGLRGIAFVGFPLHPPDKPAIARAAHLADASGPLLFVQGTRDELAPLPRLRPVIAALGTRAELHVVDRADHALAGCAADIAAAIAAWMSRIAP
jgi:hypothetical protein